MNLITQKVTQTHEQTQTKTVMYSREDKKYKIVIDLLSSSSLNLFRLQVKNH